MRSLKRETDYLAAVERAESEYGPDHLQTGDALVALAKFYESAGLFRSASACDERIQLILEKYLGLE